ncbi:methyltransferase domain-containing protein [Fibrisoma montanum]|uniref:Methyltransferase domain-containing protein n=1 Tax=Fibrisoma montanum TaxID=2305895 RepID=A0A418M7S9_9BACT|nr:class I SAM-dependent methyltransferase [Fibrisoma montanum]RIV22153.1 methyltransferase domain-containing protein [Fibrisoma montanum]
MTFDTITETIDPHQGIVAASAVLGFAMNADVLTASLLRTLARSKPSGTFLELGTGTGLSTAWLLDGMDQHSTLISVDNDAACQAIAERFLGHDKRLTLVCQDGTEWIDANTETFDFIFADTWAGKYLQLDETLAMLKPGGLYVIDDMLPQPNWPDGHDAKAQQLVAHLEDREDIVLTKLAWSTGLIIATKKD